MSLFTELKRRNVLRVAAAYITVSWLLIQVVETLFPVFELGDAAIRNVVILLAVGFIPAVILAWVFELTPEGLVRDGDADHGSAAAQSNTKRLDRIIIISLTLAVGYFAIDKFMLDPARDQAREQAIAEAAREEGRAEAADRDTGLPVLAVLPFSALTTSEDSRFFAVGVHDDLLTRLANIPSMLVISRTSVMEYRDTTKNMRQIGEELGASMLLEGGVQSAGNRIRINAQLIDARTDEHLWAETYDRELTADSIFDVQDDIAIAIADALHVTLTAADESSPAPTSSIAAYRAFHEAKELRAELDGGYMREEYRAALLEALELDPNYTRPRAELVGSFSFAAFGSGDPEYVAAAEKHLAFIEQIAPGSVDLLIAQTFFTYYVTRDYGLALEFADAALALAPSDVELLGVKTWIQRRQGDLIGRVETQRQIRTLQPLDPGITVGILWQLYQNHNYDEAEAELEQYPAITDFAKWIEATLQLRHHGDLSQYQADVEQIEQLSEEDAPAYVWDARFTNRDFEGALAALDQYELREVVEEFNHIIASDWLRATLATNRALGRDDANQVLVDELEQKLEEILEELAELGMSIQDEAPFYITKAIISAYRGQRLETIGHIQTWYRTGGQDWANRAGYRQGTCNLLGIAGAADEAVSCIRDGLREPSTIASFLETKLPYYDSIRDEPVFQELVAELEAS